MGRAEIKRDRENYRVSLFSNSSQSRREKAHYWNIINKDPAKLAQIFIDLYLEGFPIFKAAKIASLRVQEKDWLGI